MSEVMTAPTTTKTDLLLLGLLLDRPMHGYDLHQQIRAEGIDRWFSISAAGVYYSLRKLREQGWVVETGQPGGASRKATYHLTDDGRRSFFAAMEDELASQESAYLDYDLVIYLLNRLPWQRALPQLEKRQAFLAEQSREVKAVLAEAGGGSLTVAILDHKLRFLQMEQAWLRGVIDRIRTEGANSAPEYEGDRLMILKGNLRDFHLPDLLYLIISGQHSGTLTVSDGAETWILSFDEGQPSTGGSLRWGEPPMPVANCEQVLRGLCELFRWREGRFTFDQQGKSPSWAMPVPCTAEELILRGCRQVDNWDIIQQLVPGADTILELSAPERLEGLSLTPIEEQVAAAVDGISDVASIARRHDLTLFETSRALYCLTAIGALCTADVDKIRLRRAFLEIVELMCRSTLPWRSSPEDRTCEEEVNVRAADLPISLEEGHVVEHADPRLNTEDLKGLYEHFLLIQYEVISHRFGQANAREAFERTIHRLSPELQGVARRYGFERVSRN